MAPQQLQYVINFRNIQIIITSNILFYLVTPPPIQPRGVAVFNKEADIFGAEPFVKAKDSDPFGMDDFGRLVPSQVDPPETSSSLKLFDQRLTEMREGFSRGISFGEDDFNIETLDPLRS